MADPGQTHYRILGLNRAFALASLALLGSTIWAVLADWAREWKRWQRIYQVEEAERAEAALAAIETPQFQEERARLHGAIQQALDSMAAHRREVGPLESAWKRARGEHYAAQLEHRKVKAEYQALKWGIEAQQQRRADPSWGEDELREKEAEVWEKRLAEESAEAELGATEAAYERATAALREAEKGLDGLERERAPLLVKIEEARPTTVSSRLLRLVRDFPGLDFMAPSLRVIKVVLENLWFDLNFPVTRMRRVDMCQTCHVPIDDLRYAQPDPAKSGSSWGGSNPLKTHPRLDLFLSASSPHPLEKVGCTICHRGNGEALDFVRVDHTPRDAEQRRLWEAEYDWHKMHHWDFPMYPSSYVESGCLQCHHDSMELLEEEAPTLFRGYELAERFACYACHRIEWFPVTRKPGPPLAALPSKTRPEWAAPWIANPKAFRKDARMPRAFHLENSVSKEWDAAAVAAVTAFLFANAKPLDLPPPPPGDAAVGKELFTTKGCLGCHAVSGIEGAEHAWSDFGPILDGVGTKLAPAWIYAWIRDPRSMWPETRMPDLRLTEEEAAHITAYLTTLRETPPGWKEGVPQPNPEVLRAQLTAYLLSRTSEAETIRQVDEVSAKGTPALAVAVGREFVLRQGCYSCHEIPGREFERGQPIGTELTEWGSKNFEQLDFGHLHREGAWKRWLASREAAGVELPESVRSEKHLPERREAWISQKLRTPRSFDFEKERAPLELFRMPQFDFTEEEIHALATFALGLVKDDVPLSEKDRPRERDRIWNDGAAIVRRRNCAGCHVLRMEEIAYRSEEGEERVVRGRTTIQEGGETFFQVWEAHPGVGFPPSTLFVEDTNVLRRTPAVGGGILPALAAFYREKREWGPDEAADFGRHLSPPFLIGEGWKVQVPWLFSFLKKPETLRPQLDVRMPDFGFTDEEARLVAEYFPASDDREFGRFFARNLQQTVGGSAESLAREAKVPGRPDLAAEKVRILEEGGRGAADALPPLVAFGRDKGVTFPTAPPALDYEFVEARDAGYLAAREQQVGDYLDKARRLTSVEGFNCFQCHYRGEEKPPGDDPLTFAPDLERARTRLREDWVFRWISDPQKLYPGTNMPSVLPEGTEVPENIRAILDASRDDLVRALRDFLFNMDRIPVTAQ
jgi:cbb3-type cytochrome oxidase cytochrome c subunit